MDENMELPQKEKINIKKAAVSLVSGLSYFKTIMLMIKIAVIVGIVITPIMIYKSGFKKGNAEGFTRGYSQALKEHPPVTINGDGAVINQNKEEKRGFRACIYPLTFGW